MPLKMPCNNRPEPGLKHPMRVRRPAAPQSCFRQAAQHAYRLVASLLFAPLLTGCATVKVHLGLRVALAKTPVLNMEASLPHGSAIAPGENSPLVVTFTGQNNKLLVTEGQGKGKVLWRDLAIAASVVTVSRKGIVSLPHDPRLSEGKTGHLSITIPSQPGLHADLDVPLTYAYAFRSPYAGPSGSDGINGTDGTNGLDGSPGSIDPNNPSPGGNGSNGTDGGDGGDGTNGGDGPPLQVFLTLRPGTPQLLQAGVLAPGHKERFYLIDPQGGSLTVISAGGAGGRGGKAGRGGRGGAGGIGSTNGSSGSEGRDGRAGSDGSPGRAGTIAITYDPQAKPFLNLLHTSNPGGPPPTFTEAPVAPLW